MGGITMMRICGVLAAALIAGCSGNGAAAADPEFVDATPSVAAFTLAFEDGSDTTSVASPSPQASADVAASLIAGATKAQIAALNNQVATVIGWIESGLQGRRPAAKSATSHTWKIDTNKGIVVRFTIEKLSAAHFNWIAEAKKSADPDAAYLEILRAPFERDASLAAPGRGNGMLGIDLDAYAAVTSGTSIASTATGKILLGFRHGPKGSHHRYLLQDYSPDPAVEPALSRYLDVVHATESRRVWTLGAGTSLGASGAASKLEKFHSRVRQINGSGGWGSKVAFAGDLPDGGALFVRECWDAAAKVSYRRGWNCDIPTAAARHATLDFEAGCRLAGTDGGINIGGNPAGDTSDSPNDDSNFEVLRANCLPGAPAALADEAAAELRREGSVPADDTSLVRGSSASGFQQAYAGAAGSPSGAVAPVPASPLSLSVGSIQPVLFPDGGTLNHDPHLNGAADEHASVFPPGALSGLPNDWVLVVDTNVLSSKGPQGGQWKADFAPGYGDYAGQPGPVFRSPMPLGACPPYQDETFDLDYAIPGSLVIDPTVDAGDAPGRLLMVYEGTNSCFGNTDGGRPGFYSTLGLATSDDDGRSWPEYRKNRTLLPNQDPDAGPSAPLGAWGGEVCHGNDPCDGGLPATYGRYAISGAPVTVHDLMSGNAISDNKNGMGDTQPSAFVDTVHVGDGTYLYAIFASTTGSGPLGFTSYPGAPERAGIAVARARLNGGHARLQLMKWYAPDPQRGTFDLISILPDGGACTTGPDCRTNRALGYNAGGLRSSIFPMDLDGGVGTDSFTHCQAAGPGSKALQEQQAPQLSYVTDLGEYLQDSRHFPRLVEAYMVTFVCASAADPLTGDLDGGPGHAMFYSMLNASQYSLSHQEQWSPPQEIIGSWAKNQIESSNCQDAYDTTYPTFMSLTAPVGDHLIDAPAGELSMSGFVFGTHGCETGSSPRTYSTRQFTFTMPSAGAGCKTQLCCLQAGGTWDGSACR